MQQQQQNEGTPIVIQGRFVWGKLEMRKKKVYGTQMDQINPKTGEPVMETTFGLAIPKPSPQSNQHEVENFQKLWNALCTEGGKLGFASPLQGNFAWKVTDGDGKKQDGTPYPEHSRGCLVVSCSTRYPVKLMAWEGNEIKQVTSDQIKCGDYVQVALNINGHGAPNAGLYTNPSYVARFAYGPEIVNAPDASTIFGNTPPPMPMGASATPVGGGSLPFAGQMQQQGPGSGMGGFAPQAPQQQGQAPTAQAPQQPMQPNYAPLPPQFQPQQPSQAPGLPMHGGGVQQPMGAQGPAGFNPGGPGQWNPNGYNGQ